MRNVPKNGSLWHSSQIGLPQFSRGALVRAAVVFALATCGHLAVVETSVSGERGGTSVRQMLGDPLYWPADCTATTCVLTGNGGIMDVWLHHVDEHRGKTFVVKGKCASACEWAYLRARKLGEKTVVLPGARFVRHNPERAKWR